MAEEQQVANSVAATDSESPVDQAQPASVELGASQPDATAPNTAEGNADDASTGDKPVEYEPFTMPDGIPIDETLLASVTPIFQEMGLSQEQAQKLVDFEAQRAQGQATAFQEQVTAWQKSVYEDKEIGGDEAAVKANVALADKVISTHFESGFIEALRGVGLTNHPEVIRGLVRIGKTYMTEDQPGSGQAPQPAKSRAEILYGKS